MKTGPIAETRLSHLICPRRLRVEAGFGTWSPVRCSAGRGGCRGFIGPVPLPLSIRLPMNIAGRLRCVKRFSTGARTTGEQAVPPPATKSEEKATEFAPAGRGRCSDLHRFPQIERPRSRRTQGRVSERIYSPLIAYVGTPWATLFETLR